MMAAGSPPCPRPPCVSRRVKDDEGSSCGPRVCLSSLRLISKIWIILKISLARPPGTSAATLFFFFFFCFGVSGPACLLL